MLGKAALEHALAFTSVTMSSDDLIFRILISGNWSSASGCLKGELVLTITPAGTQNEPTVVLVFYSSNVNIIFCHVLYSPPKSMLVNRVFEISGELQAELVLTIMPHAPRVSSYCRIQSICCYAYVTMTLEAEGRRFGDLVAQWVFKMTAYGATSGSGVVGLTTFCFRCDSCELWNNVKLWSFHAFKWKKSITSMEFSESIWLYT